MAGPPEILKTATDTSAGSRGEQIVQELEERPELANDFSEEEIPDSRQPIKQ